MEPETQFHLFGASHILALVILGAGIWFLLKFLTDLPSEQTTARTRRGMAVFLISQMVFWRMVFLFQGEFSLLRDLPFHLCGFSALLLTLYLLQENQELFNILFYWVLSGSVLALLIPDLRVDFPHPRYFSMFVSHGTSLFILLYLVVVERKIPNENSYFKAIRWLILYGLILAWPINLVSGSNYLFLRHVPKVDFTLIDLLPRWPWYIAILAGFFSVLYYGMYRVVELLQQDEDTSVRKAGYSS